MATNVTLIDGPLDGDVIAVSDPWPRSTIYALDGATTVRYYVVDGTTTAEWADPDSELYDDPLEEETVGEPGPPGDTGPQGLPGDPGPTVNWLGAWDAGTVYGEYDVVQHNGSSWIVLPGQFSTAGVSPTETTIWTYVAQKGATGTTGSTGSTGPQGPEGPAGPSGALGSATHAFETFAALAADASVQDTCDNLPAPGVRVLRIGTDYPARVRVYATVADQVADAARADDVDPVGNHGCMLEVITTTTMLELTLSPTVDIHADDPIPITVQNRDTVTRTIIVDFFYIQTEA